MTSILLFCVNNRRTRKKALAIIVSWTVRNVIGSAAVWLWADLKINFIATYTHMGANYVQFTVWVLNHCFGWHWGFYLTMTEICCPNMIYLHRSTQTFPMQWLNRVKFDVFSPYTFLSWVYERKIKLTTVLLMNGRALCDTCHTLMSDMLCQN